MNLRLVMALAAAAAIASPAQAVIWGGHFYNMTGPIEINYADLPGTPAGNDRVSYGIPLAGGQTSLTFAGATVGPVMFGQQFVLGDLTFNN